MLILSDAPVTPITDSREEAPHLAQIELREALPFPVTTRLTPLLTSEEQAGVWTKALGEY